MGLLIRTVITAVALWIATLVLSGIEVTTHSTAKKVGTLLAVAVIFGLINGVLRPIIKKIGCGLYVLTLGLVSLVVNGALFQLTSWVAGLLDLPFHVNHFWPTAILGALIVGIIGWALGLIVPDKAKN